MLILNVYFSNVNNIKIHHNEIWKMSYLFQKILKAIGPFTEPLVPLFFGDG